MRSANLLPTPATWCSSKNDHSPLCASRMQGTGQDGYAGQLGRHVDGERAPQAASLCLTYRALISPTKYLDTASETGPETLAPMTL